MTELAALSQFTNTNEKNFAPSQTPFLGGAGRQKFNQLEIVTTFTYRPSLVKVDAHNFVVIVVTDPQTNKHTYKQTGPITIHCSARLSAQCNEMLKLVTERRVRLSKERLE